MKRVLEYADDFSQVFIKTQLAEQISSAVVGCSTADVFGDGVRLCATWDLETMQAVAQWQIPTFSPMFRDYTFVGRFQPYKHQLKICSFLTVNKRGFCLADMGTGKTASVIWSLDYLFKAKKIKRVLIIGVLTNMHSTWVKEFFAINPMYQVTVLHGSKTKRERLAKDGSQIHIINHDGVEVIQKQLLANNYDVVVIDELTAYKNSKSDRFKTTAPLTAQATYAWGLTGTPMPNSPDETYGQIKIINPARLAGISAGRYKEMVMRKTSEFTWVARFDAAETVRSYMQPAIKIDKSEVLTLPTVQYLYHKTPLTKGQEDFYKQMKQASFVGNEELSISAVNGGALMAKLLQVATGAIYDDNGTPLKFDATPRIEKTIELIREARQRSTDPLKGKTIVFAPFRHTVALLQAALEKEFSVAVVTGDTPTTKRAEIFSEFQTSASPDVLLAVPRTMSHGVTATAASSIIWFGPVTSNETYQQACNRIDRPGQSQEMTIHHLHATPVEEKLYKTLQKRKLSQVDLLNMYHDFIRGI